MDKRGLRVAQRRRLRVPMFAIIRRGCCITLSVSCSEQRRVEPYPYGSRRSSAKRVKQQSNAESDDTKHIKYRDDPSKALKHLCSVPKRQPDPDEVCRACWALFRFLCSRGNYWRFIYS